MKLILSTICCLFSLFSTSFGQTITLPYEEQFEWQVKQIDEFIDRFNNAEDTPIRQFLQDRYAMDSVKQDELLMTLFNLERKWDTTQVRQFLSVVTNTSPVPELDFYDHNWYAELECSGIVQGSVQHFTLILTIKRNPATGGSRWVINSVSANFLPHSSNTQARFPQTIQVSGDNIHTLNPASFGTNFMGLVRAMEDKQHYQNYINQDQADQHLLAFFNMLYQDQLKFRQVDHITYHFLQVPGWVFQVEDFTRQSSNSGWLISKLIQIPEGSKNNYKQKTLFLTQH